MMIHLQKFKWQKHLLCLVLFALASNPIVAQQRLIKGFSAKASSSQLELELRFDEKLSKASVGSNIKELSAKPHHLGSAQGKLVAESVRQKFIAYGWDAKIETYHVLFPTPKTRVLELTAPTKFTALLKEPAFPEDQTSGQEGQLPTYNAWGADGDVTGELVFVNFGLPDDYLQLEKLGISVKGKIVIAKYGRSWRGIKPKIAYEHGAIGCIIYSDPKEDGYYQGEAYPKGPFKNEHTVQRGSVMDMVIYPGDPLTPNIAATKDAKRIERSAAPTILKIPVLPISYHDALPLLSALDGPIAPAEWRGALPITYRIGGGKAKVHLKVESNWDIVPAYNVIAKIKGATHPNEWIIRGNHHDAWVNGAADPISGLAAELEEAKAIGALVKAGYRPKRTLVYCAWDGEEQSLLGSTEWVEDHAEELKKKAVAYINTDGNGRGFLEAGGSHALEQLVDGIAKEVTDPLTSISIYERKKARGIISASSLSQKKTLLKKDSLALGALGTGSDYSAFLQHLGIPSLNLGFGGEDEGGEYHSIYDSYDNYIRFKDSDFSYGVALAKTAGRAVLRLADAEVLPFDFTNLYQTINTYTTEVSKLADQLREDYKIENQLISSHKYQYAADPKETFVAPKNKPEVPVLDFSKLNAALASLQKAAENINLVASAVIDQEAKRTQLNELLFQAEKQLLNPNGLPRRPWYQHTIYAPGFYTGYGVKTLPGIREAIEQGYFQEAQEQINITTEKINNLAIYLNRIKPNN
jgi:N-acetylated-alpha-linked acidic dipeptidase